MGYKCPPCGTPDVNSIINETLFPISTCCVLTMMYDLNQFRLGAMIPIYHTILVFVPKWINEHYQTLS